MKRIQGQSSDSDQRLKRPKMSDNYDRPSTSQEGPKIQNMNITGNIFTNSTVNINQIMDSKPKVEIDKLDGFPFTPEVFIGRNAEIEDLHKLFQKRQKVLITGIAGIGKSRLAIECAIQWVQAGMFTRAVFINVETEETTNKRIESLADTLNVNPDVVNIYKYFNDHKLSSGLTLFILDNVEQNYNIRQLLPSKKFENIKILATSQDCEYQLLFREFKLDKLVKDDAIELMKALFEKFLLDLQDNENSRADFLSVQPHHIPSIQDLVIKLDGHPLALQHACAFCVDNILYEGEDDVSECIKKYLDQIKVKITKEFPLEYDTEYKKTIFSAISVNVEKAIKKNQQLRDFLFTMSLLNPIFIEFKYFRTCGCFSEDQIKESRRTLRKHSIIHFRDDYLEDINVHRLVLFICQTMLRKHNLEAHIVGIIFGMYFGDKRAQIYHSYFLCKNTKFEKKDLAGHYINAFKKSHFMSELSCRLQRIDLTYEDLEGWSVLHYCKFAEHNYWFKYFDEYPKMMESKESDVDWPHEIVDLLKGNDVDLYCITWSKTVVKDLTALHFYAVFGSNLFDFYNLIAKIEVAEIVKSNRLFNLATRNKKYHFGIELLNRGAKYENKDMALFCAVLDLNLDLTRTLIKEGADVNFSDDAGVGPIFLAIATADDEILNELQKQGADIESALNVKYGVKNTALLSVIKGEFVAAHDYPNKEFNFFSHLHRSETQVLTSVKLLIKNGADVNCFDFNNNTPLIFALINHYVDVAVKLIQSGAQVNTANDDEHTPLKLAKSAKLDGSLIKLLEERVRICEGQSVPTPTFSDLEEPKWFFNKYWKWRLKYSKDPYDQMIHQKTCTEIQTHLEESQKNIKKLLLSTSDLSFKASIQDLDEKIEICVIGLEQEAEAIDDLNFSSFAKVLVDNFNASIKKSIHSCEYAVEVLETLAEFLFETRFELPANLVDLYDKYVDIKFKNNAIRSAKTLDNDETEALLVAVRRIHQKLAVRILLPEEKSLPGLQELKKFKVGHEKDKEKLVRIGILTLKEGQLTYLKNSVAQYFLSEYLISNFNSEAVQTMFLHQILIEDKFELNREFFDSQLELFFEDERRKQLNCLERNRFHILSGVELTDKVKETVRLILQGDKDFLLLERVAQEGCTRIIIFLLKQFKSDMDILLTMVSKAGKHGETAFHFLPSKVKSETLKGVLDILKENLSQENLKRLLVAANGYDQTILHYLSLYRNNDNLQITLNFLKENLNQEDLKVLLEKRDLKGETAVDSSILNSVEHKILLDFVKDNLLN